MPGTAIEDSIDKVFQKYNELNHEKYRFLSVGGDHIISYPILKCYQTTGVVYIYLDAHMDLYNDERPYNWNVAAQIQRMGIETVNIGFRNHTLEKSGSNKTIFLGNNFQANNIIRTLNKIVNKKIPIYLSIDADILEPLFFPYVNSPVPCGLLPKDLMAVIVEILEKYEIVIGIDINEYNPQMDHAGHGAHFIAYLIELAFLNWRQ
jgi:arginase family enzyme